MGVRQARAEAMTDSSELAEFVAQAVDVGVVDAGEAPDFWKAMKDMPVAGLRPSMPQPFRWPWMTTLECLRTISMAGRPMEFMLTMAQVPLFASMWMRRSSIWSRSPVMLAAYMTRLPVRSACR